MKANKEVRELFEVLAKKTMKNRQEALRVFTDPEYAKRKVAEIERKYGLDKLEGK